MFCYKKYLMSSMKAKPILKWVGGKSQLLSRMQNHFPSSFNSYYEPFVGGGAVFFNLDPLSSVISDRNGELINLYKVVANKVEELIVDLNNHENNEVYFKELRSIDWFDLTDVKAASRMIYLNRTCFNGLYRLNSKGKFNTSFGNFKNPNIINESNLRAASFVLSRALIQNLEYKDAIATALPGDFIFFDPPYMPISKSSDFNRYNSSPFTESDQIELADLFWDLDSRGVYVCLTNSDHNLVRQIYKDHVIIPMNTTRWVSCSNNRSCKDLFIVGKNTSRLKNTHLDNKTI